MNTLELILELIRKKSESHAQFEKDINVKPKTVDGWKRGNSKSYLKILPEIAAYFNVTTDYLLGNDTSDTKNPPDDNDIKFALFGTTEIDDDVYDDVKRFAKIAKQMREEKKNGNG